MMLQFEYKGAAAVVALTPNVEYHGDERVLTIDIKLEIDPNDDLLTQLDVQEAGDEFGAISFKHVFEPCHVSIGPEKFSAATVDKLKLTIEERGSATLACSVRVRRPKPGQLSALHDCLREQRSVAISGQYAPRPERKVERDPDTAELPLA